MLSGQLLRSARLSAGLSQVELARRAKVGQSAISIYESSKREPSVKTLAKLVEAAGQRLDIRVRAPGEAPLITRVMRNREEIIRIASRRGMSNVRVFGSVARGEETAQSDIDLLVDVGPGVGLFSLFGCERELKELLSASVDLVPSVGLKPRVAPSVFRDAVPV